MYLLRLVIGTMLSSPATFPKIGNPLGELADIPPIAGYVADAEQLFEKCKLVTPRDPVRRAYASYLTDQALMFFIGHEISHISCGHVDYLSAQTEEASTALASIADATVRFERQCLELEADARSIVSRMSSFWGQLEEPNVATPWSKTENGRADALRHWGVSLNVLFHLFGDMRFTPGRIESSSYPPFALRRLFAQSYARYLFVQRFGENEIPSAEKQLSASSKDVEQALSIVIEMPDKCESTWVPDTEYAIEYLLRLQNHQRAVMVDKLRPYAYEIRRA